MRSHTQERLVACPTCGSMFSSNTKLFDHLHRQAEPVGEKDALFSRMPMVLNLINLSARVLTSVHLLISSEQSRWCVNIAAKLSPARGF